MKRYHVLRHLWALLLVLLLLPCLAGCENFDEWLYENQPAVDGDEDPSPSPSQASTAGPAYYDLFGLPYAPEGAAPYSGVSQVNRLWKDLVYESLFTSDERFEPVPMLCLRADTEDNRVFRLALRPNVSFHNGETLSASDVAESMNLAGKEGSPFAALLTDVARVAVVDSLTLEVTLHAPNPRFPALLTFPIVPRGSRDTIAPGTGPYRMVLSEEDNYLIPHEGWWRAATLPRNRIELVGASSPKALVDGFGARTLSLVACNPFDTLSVQFHGIFESWDYDTPVLQFIGINTKRAPLTQALLREALSAAIDRDALLNLGYGQRATPAVFPVPPVSPLYGGWGIEGYDPNVVMDLLAELGWSERNEEGFLEYTIGRTTHALRLVLIVPMENEARVRTARRISEMLATYGIGIDVQPLPQAEYMTALEKEEFDLYLGATQLRLDFSCEVFAAGGALGYGGFHSATVTELWDSYAASGLPEDWDAYADAWATEAPVIPLLFERHSLLSQRGLLANPKPLWGNLFYDLPSWGIRQNKP